MNTTHQVPCISCLGLGYDASAYEGDDATCTTCLGEGEATLQEMADRVGVDVEELQPAGVR